MIRFLRRMLHVMADELRRPAREAALLAAQNDPASQLYVSPEERAAGTILKFRIPDAPRRPDPTAGRAN